MMVAVIITAVWACVICYIGAPVHTQCICILLSISHLFSFRHVFYFSAQLFSIPMFRLHSFFNSSFLISLLYCILITWFFFIKNFLLFSFNDRFHLNNIQKQKQRSLQFTGFFVYTSITSTSWVCGAQYQLTFHILF